MGFRIEGSVALVTGANRGIGRAITTALLAAGVTKLYAAVRKPASVDDLVRAYGGRVVPLQLDVTDAEQIAAAAIRAGDVQLLVNNAGALFHGNAPITDSSWLAAGREEMNVNLFGTFEIIQAFAPVLGRNGGGAIVNINSIASLVNFPLFISYSFSKAALHSLTQASRAFLKSQGTQVFGVYPGPVDTDMGAGLEMDKASPSSVAAAIISGIEAGTEEILPDIMSQQLGGLFSQDPKGLERQVAAMVAA